MNLSALPLPRHIRSDSGILAYDSNITECLGIWIFIGIIYTNIDVYMLVWQWLNDARGNFSGMLVALSGHGMVCFVGELLDFILSSLAFNDA